ncbi:MAG: restriction endonuclease subunit S [Archaeoglobaceae archaeon]
MSLDMGSNWSEYVFSQAVNINPKRNLAKGTVAPYIEMSSVLPDKRKPSEIKMKEYSYGGAKFKSEDTLLARITPCLENGKIALVPRISEEIGFGSTEFIVLSGKDGITDNLFVYYLARSHEVRDFAIKSMTGSSGRQRVPIDAFDHLTVKIPPLQEQQKIAEILGALDDKIELNYKMNKTLEEIAQAIFKNWFVDFKPFKDNLVYNEEMGKEIPGGWEVDYITRLIEFDPTIRLEKNKKYLFVSMSDVEPNCMACNHNFKEYTGSGARFTFGDTLLARITPSLEHGKTAFVGFLEEDRFGFGSTEFIVMHPKRTFLHEFVYLLAREKNFRDHAIKSMTGSSGRQRVPREALEKYKFVVPPEDILELFHIMLEPFFHQISTNFYESMKLAQIRDTLLPKLLSGEIRVNNEEELGKKENNSKINHKNQKTLDEPVNKE